MISSSEYILKFFQSIYSSSFVTLFFLEAIIYSIINLYILLPMLYRLTFRKNKSVHDDITSDIPGNPHAFDNIFISFFRTLPEPNNTNLVWTRVPLPSSFKEDKVNDIFIEGYLSHPVRMQSMSIYPEGKKLIENNLIQVYDQKTNQLIEKNEDLLENYDPTISIPRSIELYSNLKELNNKFRLRITKQYYPHMINNSCIDYLPYQHLNQNKPTGDFLIYCSSYEYALISFRNYLVSPGVKITTPIIYYYNNKNQKIIIRNKNEVITGCNNLSILYHQNSFLKLLNFCYYYQYLIYMNLFLFFLIFHTNYVEITDESINILKNHSNNSFIYLLNLIKIIIFNIFIVLKHYYINYFNIEYIMINYFILFISFIYHSILYIAFVNIPIILVSILLTYILNDLMFELSRKRMISHFETILMDKNNKNNFLYPDLKTASKVSQPSKLHQYCLNHYNLTPKYYQDLQENNILTQSNNNFTIKYGNYLRITTTINAKLQKYWSLTVYDEYGIPQQYLYDDIAEKTFIDKRNKDIYNITIDLTNLPSNNPKNKNYLNDDDKIIYTEDIEPRHGINHLDLSKTPKGFLIFRYVHPHEDNKFPIPSTETFTIITKEDYYYFDENQLSLKKNN